MNKILAYIIMLLLIATPGYAFVNSTIMCIDNSTLQENITVYKDSNMTNLTLNSYCPYDCDNITFSCNPPEYQSGLISLGVFLAFIVGLILVYRWFK